MPVPRTTLAARLAPILLLAGCVHFSPYGNATGAELEPLADGWEPSLSVRNPQEWDATLDQYHWVSKSGVRVAVGTLGYSEGSFVQVEFRNRGTAPVYVEIAAAEGERVHAGPPVGASEVNFDDGKVVRIDPDHRRAITLRGIPWLASPHVGDRFAVRFEIRCGDTAEVCPCVFSVNHLCNAR